MERRWWRRGEDPILAGDDELFVQYVTNFLYVQGVL